ncbi:MAG: HEPN domain-containing protein [Thermoplasmataceae archaeon]|jgi:HEPN domain-containing protein
MSSEDFVQFLAQKADRFLITAKLQIDEEFYDLATFSLQQSLELTLKSILLSSAGDYPRSHSLRDLLKLAFESSGGNCGEKAYFLLNQYSFQLNMLEDAYSTSRYFQKSFDEDDVKKLYEITGVITDELRHACK